MHSKLPARRVRTWTPESPLTLLVADLASKGHIQDEIASKIGVSKQRLNQIISKLRNEGVQFRFWHPVSEVANQLGVSSQLVEKQLGKISSCNFTERSSRRRIRISDDGVRELKQLLSKGAACKFCGALLARRQHKFCSAECRGLHRSTRGGNVLRFGERPCYTPGAVMLKVREATEAIGLPDEGWITLADAESSSSLSKMQIRYLALQGSIALRESKYAKWRGHPVKLVHPLHVQAAEEVYKAHNRITTKEHQ